MAARPRPGALCGRRVPERAALAVPQRALVSPLRDQHADARAVQRRHPRDRDRPAPPAPRARERRVHGDRRRSHVRRRLRLRTRDGRRQLQLHRAVLSRDDSWAPVRARRLRMPRAPRRHRAPDGGGRSRCGARARFPDQARAVRGRRPRVRRVARDAPPARGRRRRLRRRRGRAAATGGRALVALDARGRRVPRSSRIVALGDGWPGLVARVLPPHHGHAGSGREPPRNGLVARRVRRAPRAGGGARARRTPRPAAMADRARRLRRRGARPRRLLPAALLAGGAARAPVPDVRRGGRVGHGALRRGGAARAGPGARHLRPRAPRQDLLQRARVPLRFRARAPGDAARRRGAPRLGAGGDHRRGRMWRAVSGRRGGGRRDRGSDPRRGERPTVRGQDASRGRRGRQPPRGRARPDGRCRARDDGARRRRRAEPRRAARRRDAELPQSPPESDAVHQLHAARAGLLRRAPHARGARRRTARLRGAGSQGHRRIRRPLLRSRLRTRPLPVGTAELSRGSDVRRDAVPRCAFRDRAAAPRRYPPGLSPLRRRRIRTRAAAPRRTPSRAGSDPAPSGRRRPRSGCGARRATSRGSAASPARTAGRRSRR